jgi:glycerol-1-phosphate dehydrogenase [NAD(P)+]
MNANKLLGTTFECECGRTHTVPIWDVIYSEDSITRIAELLRQYTSGRAINMIADKRTCEVAGKAVEQQLDAGAWKVRRYVIPDPPQRDPVCDDVTREKIEQALVKPCDLLIAAGSGVVNDLCKWISTETGIPYVAVATAASMNGYASQNIAPTIKGVKRVIKGTVPLSIIAVPSIIENAPFELTTAGLGDVVAKPVSITDWRINQLLFNEYYCPLCAKLIRDLEPAYIEHPKNIRRKDPSTIEALFSALIYSGISMTIAGTSFPASGGEHLISHVLDMISSLENVPHDYHGRQVGLGAIFASALYEQLAQLESPQFHAGCEETNASFWKALTPIVALEHARKRLRVEHAVSRLREPGVWDEIRNIIATETMRPERIKHCLREAGAAHRIEDIGCTRERFVNAVLHCHQIRERYTVIDLARAAGVIPTEINTLIDEYLTE